MNEPTELQLHIAAMTTAVRITRDAFRAGASQELAPRWEFTNGMIQGHFTSEDDSAWRALEAWRTVLGVHRICSYSFTGTCGPREARSVYVTVDEVSVRLCASIPAAAAVAEVRELVAA